jgi:hypothetical protein
MHHNCVEINVDIVEHFVCSYLLVNSKLRRKAVAKLARTVWQLARKPAQAAGVSQALKWLCSAIFGSAAWLSQAEPSSGNTTNEQ